MEEAAVSTKLSIGLGFSPNPRSSPILDGDIEIEGVDLTCSRVNPGELFHRQLTHQEFDVSEMSISSLLMITAAGNKDWVALPIFSTRHFFGSQAIARNGAGIEQPEQMKGKRVGVNEYQQTAALWSRGFFHHEYGVKATDVEWFMERTPENSHLGATGFEPPKGVTLNFIPPETSMGEMMMKGELDAIQHYFWGSGGMNRSIIDLAKQPEMHTIFPDPKAEAARYYKKTGIFPFNHTVILRRSIYEANPWVARNIFEAFGKAKELSYARTFEATEPWLDTGVLDRAARPSLDTDIFPYGLAANRMVIEKAMEFSHEQGLTPRVMTPEEVYAPTMLDT
jgi:4,5-dihydroxyphthalate decarboxylase